MAFFDDIEVAGRFTDWQTGLQNNRARWYNTLSGQFMSRDSWGYSAGDTNLFRYAGNSWPNGTDPSGHFFLLMSLMSTATGFMYGWMTGQPGHFDMQRAIAGGVSGS